MQDESISSIGVNDGRILPEGSNFTASLMEKTRRHRGSKRMGSSEMESFEGISDLQGNSRTHSVRESRKSRKRSSQRDTSADDQKKRKSRKKRNLEPPKNIFDTIKKSSSVGFRSSALSSASTASANISHSDLDYDNISSSTAREYYMFNKNGNRALTPKALQAVEKRRKENAKKTLDQIYGENNWGPSGPTQNEEEEESESVEEVGEESRVEEALKHLVQLIQTRHASKTEEGRNLLGKNRPESGSSNSESDDVEEKSQYVCWMPTGFPAMLPVAGMSEEAQSRVVKKGAFEMNPAEEALWEETLRVMQHEADRLRNEASKIQKSLDDVRKMIRKKKKHSK